jgi:hypothetical protein
MTEPIRLRVRTDLPQLPPLSDAIADVARVVLEAAAEAYDSLPAETKASIERFIVALEHIDTDPSLNGRLLRELRAQFAELKAADASVDDTHWWAFADRIDYFRLFIVAREYAEHLEAKRRAPGEARKAAVRHWMERVGTLTADGLSLAQIAAKISAERGKPTSRDTVKRWRRAYKAGAHRETSTVT